MLRPEEVPDVPDEELSADLRHCEKFIDQQLSKKGTKGGVAIVGLPDGMERIEARVRFAYAQAGWWIESAGMGRIRLERPATDPRRKAWLPITEEEHREFDKMLAEESDMAKAAE